jgi:hypothetical protein
MAKPIVVSQPYQVTAGEIIQPSGELAKYGKQGSDIPSASTTDLGSATGDYVRVTGSASITSFGAAPAGLIRTVEFTGACTLIYNSTSMILPAAQNIVTAPYDAGIFRSRGNGNWICVSYQAASGAPPLELTKDDVGLGNVENVALSTWPGSTNIRTVGTITAGTWQGTPIAANKGGTGLTAAVQGDMIYSDATNSYARLPKATVKSRYLSNQGGLDNSPKWDTIDLATGVSGVLAGANGGRGALYQTATIPTGIALTIDMSLGNFVGIQLGSATGNVTLTITNAVPGLLNFFSVLQGGTIRALVWPSNTKQTLLGGTTWNPSGASKVDIITWVYDGVTYHILGTAPDMG